MTSFAGTAALTEFWAKVKALVATKQDALVSGTNVKTINNESILGSGNITISGGGVTPADYVVEESSGTTSGYRKWNSGRMECWVNRTISTSVNTSWGNLYRSSDYWTGGSWPVAFDTLIHCYHSIAASGGDMAFLGSVSSATTTRGDNVYILRGSGLSSSKQFVLSWYGIGTWK